MKEYFIGLLAASVLCSLTVILLGKRMSGAIRLGLGILVLTVALSPLISLLSDLSTDLDLPDKNTVADGGS